VRTGAGWVAFDEGESIDPDDAPALAAEDFDRAEIRQGETVVRRGGQRLGVRSNWLACGWMRMYWRGGARWTTWINDTLRRALE
jgi:hypothetical protein